MHERLMRLATQITTCNFLQDTVDRTMNEPALAQLLLLGTQSVAILASLIARSATFSVVHNLRIRKREDGATGAEAETSEALATRYSEEFGSYLKRLSQLLVDHKHAGALIKSLSFPYSPLILSHQKRPDGRILNGVWMTADMERQWKDHLAREQVAAHR